MRITTVTAAVKDQGRCEACSEPVTKGQSYRWVKPYRGSKRVRHATCATWRPSDLANDKISQAISAQESAADLLGAIEAPATVADAGSFAEAIKSVMSDVDGSDSISECQDAYDNLPENFQSGEMGERFEEWRDAIETWQDECQSFEPDGFECEPDPSDTEAEAAAHALEALEAWAEDVRQEAQDLLDGLEVG